MSSLSYARHRFPSVIIQHAVWLYFRFALSYRDVEDMLAERGIDTSYETVRRWVLKFSGVYAERIRRRRPRPSDRWHLDEVFIRIGGRIHYLWRAVDDEGEVLDILVQSRRDRKAALKLMRLLWSVRRAINESANLRRAEFATLQRRLIKIGARIVETATRVRIAFASACPDKTLFVDVLRQLMDMPAPRQQAP